MQRIYRISNSSLTYLFYILFGLTPLVMFTKSTEIFELNKTIFLYVLTTLISTAWIVKSISLKKVVFTSSILTIPILVFLFVNSISTYFSIDAYTSIYGYYGRFNGGLLTLISYSTLYFAYVSNMGRVGSRKSIVVILASSLIVSGYALAQRFGVDDQLWSQDVIYRVFSTFGQPNWLSSWIAMITPLVVAAYFWDTKSQAKRYAIIFMPTLYLLVIILSKSRSGLIGFAVSLLFMFIYLLKNRKEKLIGNNWVKYIIINIIAFLLLFFFAGTPWSPSLFEYDSNHSVSDQIYDRRGDNTILTRKYVWIAAIQSWKDHPYIGTGPETFAYIFPRYKPVEHNNTVEWSHIFNKAHNEYLNYLSNIGLLGLASYLFLIIASVYSFYRTQKVLKGKSEEKITNFALFAGFVSVLVTNFVGFSTVTTNLLAFMFPAFSLSLTRELPKTKVQGSSAWQFVAIGISVFASIIILGSITKYWFSDYFIAKAESLGSREEYTHSIYYADLALTLSNNAVLKSKASSIYSDYALSRYFDDREDFEKYLVKSLSLSDEAISDSPVNSMFQIDKANLYLKLSATDFKYLEDAKGLLINAISESPNDPKLWYNLGLVYAKLGDSTNAMVSFEKSSSLKPDYKTPRLGILILCQKAKDKECMRRESDYILTYIDPEDELSNSIRDQIQK